MNSIQDTIESMLAGPMQIADERHERYAAEVAKRIAEGERGKCAICGANETELLEEETIDASVERDEYTPVYAKCEACVTEDAMVVRLAGYGVPPRVRRSTLENYEVYNDLQSKMLRKVREWVGDPRMVFLILSGSTGTGKGHVAASLLRMFRQRSQWLSHAALVDGYHGRDFGERDAYLRPIQRVPVLVLDEVGGKTKTTDTPEIFHKVLEYRYEKGLRTILTTNLPLRSEKGNSVFEIIGGDRAESRLEHVGQCVTCRWEDWRKRARGAGQ